MSSLLNLEAEKFRNMFHDCVHDSPGYKILTDDTVQSPTFVGSSHFLSHCSQESLELAGFNLRSFHFQVMILTCGLKKPVIQKTFGLPWKHHLLNCPSLSNSSVYQKPRVVERQEIFFQVSGTRASNMLSRVAFKSSLITIVPSSAIFRSSKVRLDQSG